jgi:hypothetical protein
LEIFYYLSDDYAVKVAGNVSAPLSPVILAKPVDPQQQFIDQVIKEMESCSQEAVGFVIKNIKDLAYLLKNSTKSTEVQIEGINQFIESMKEVKGKVPAQVQEKIEFRIKKIQDLVNKFEPQDKYNGKIAEMCL